MLHERALRLIYKDTSLIFGELLWKDNSVTIHHRSLQKLPTEVNKIINNHSPYQLRNKNPFQTDNVHIGPRVFMRPNTHGPLSSRISKIPTTT